MIEASARNAAQSNPPRTRRDTRVAVVLAHTVLASSLLIAGFALSLVPTTACVCDCSGAYNYVDLPAAGNQVPIGTLSITGSACGDATCVGGAQTADGCLQFNVKLKQTGACHVEATASDGRMAGVDLDVQHLRDSCCGEYFTLGGTGPIDFSFDATDAGGQ